MSQPGPVSNFYNQVMSIRPPIVSPGKKMKITATSKKVEDQIEALLGIFTNTENKQEDTQSEEFEELEIEELSDEELKRLEAKVRELAYEYFSKPWIRARFARLKDRVIQNIKEEQEKRKHYDD